MLGKDDMRVPLESLPGYVECKRLHVKIRTESFTYGHQPKRSATRSRDGMTRR